MSTAEKEMKALHRRREQAKPELAAQAKKRRNKRADGGIHAVQHTIQTSRTQEAAERVRPELPPEKRWVRASTLPGMPPLPGYHLKWARRDGRARGDHANLVRYLREGWEVARKSDFPGHALPTHRLTDYGEVIGNEDTILMKIDDRLVAQRNAFFNDRRDRATSSINDTSGLNKALRKSRTHLVEDKDRSKVTFPQVEVRHRRRPEIDVPEDED